MYRIRLVLNVQAAGATLKQGGTPAMLATFSMLKAPSLPSETK